MIKKDENSALQPAQQLLEPAIRTMLRLSEIERLIRKHRIIVPPPSRKGLIALCEEGILETVGKEATTLGWLVYEDSFWKWVKGIDKNTKRKRSPRPR